MMGDVVMFPGVEVEDITPDPGEPRPDIARALRDVADLAEKGMIESAMVVYTSTDTPTIPIVQESTPWLNPFVLLGGLDKAADLVRMHTACYVDDAVIYPVTPPEPA